MKGADLIVLIVYAVGVVAFGCWFARRSGTTKEFMAAGGRLPGWVIGLSLFGTYLSSNTFIGNPGKAFGGNWNFFVFTLTIPIGAWIASRWFVKFYRSSGEISAYHHLEKRFGSWARIYVVICYLLTQVSRAGTIMVGVAMGMYAVTGWDVRTIILVTGIVVTLYTLLGGIEAVIWTDVIQSIVLTLGALWVVGTLWFGDPAGGTLMDVAQAGDKFSFGSFAASLKPQGESGAATFWVVLFFGIFINVTNFGIDQNYIQRYHAANSEKAAKRSLWIGAMAYIPVSALFFFIGTLLFGYYDAHAEEMAAIEQMATATDRPASDMALPHFIANHLPAGVGGLLIAALFAAAMSTIDTSLNSSATITLRDLFQKTARNGSEQDQMKVLRGATIFWGVVGTTAALLITLTKSNILDLWWKLSGVFAGGMLGLFLLGLLARRAGSQAAIVGVVVGVGTILWMSFAETEWMPDAVRYSLHSLTVTVVGTLTIFSVGILVSCFVRKGDAADV